MNNPLLKKQRFLSKILTGITIASIATAIVLLTKESKNKNQLADKNESGINSDSIALEKFYKKGKEKPCIDPPLEGVKIPYTSYKLIAEKGATLDLKTGSKISIPKNAFVEQNGKPLKGEVELRYREFHDAIDFFVAGIPMTYDSAGEKYQFESAGMMEMLAFQNGKPINMAPDKTINIELASNYKGTEYNLYKLDTTKNNWACLGKDKVVAQTASEGNRGKKADGENALLQETPQYKTIETKKVEIQKEKEIKVGALPESLPEPKKPEQSKNDKYTFHLDVKASEYPELAIYKGVSFEVGNENKNFDKTMYDITWDEATIKEGPKKGENYFLMLKKRSKKYDIIVYPVFEGKNYETALKVYQDKFAKYNAVLEKRNLEEKRIEGEYHAKLLVLNKQQEELELKQKAAMDNQFKQMSTDEKVKRTFAINSFGIYNCDHPTKFPQGVLCSANLTNDQNIKLICYDIYLVDHAKNALFTYIRNPITKFSFNPQSTNMLWTVENGVLYWLKPEQFKDIKNSDVMSNLKMVKVDQKFKNADEIKAFFNF